MKHRPKNPKIKSKCIYLSERQVLSMAFNHGVRPYGKNKTTWDCKEVLKVIEKVFLTKKVVITSFPTTLGDRFYKFFIYT